MKGLLFTPLLIVFIIWLHYEIKKSSTLMQESSDEFWNREAKANITRKQPINDLEYINVNTTLLDELSRVSDDDVSAYAETLRELSTAKIVNLTGYTNTDLKLKYGAANLTALSEYDANFIKLVNTVYRLGSKLRNLGEESLAREIFEYGISVGSDVSGNFIELGNIYKDLGETDKLDSLIITASSLTTLNKQHIMDSLASLHSSI